MLRYVRIPVLSITKCVQNLVKIGDCRVTSLVVLTWNAPFEILIMYQFFCTLIATPSLAADTQCALQLCELK